MVRTFGRFRLSPRAFRQNVPSLARTYNIYVRPKPHHQRARPKGQANGSPLPHPIPRGGGQPPPKALPNAFTTAVANHIPAPHRGGTRGRMQIRRRNAMQGRRNLPCRDAPWRVRPPRQHTMPHAPQHVPTREGENTRVGVQRHIPATYREGTRGEVQPGTPLSSMPHCLRTYNLHPSKTHRLFLKSAPTGAVGVPAVRTSGRLCAKKGNIIGF